MGIIIINTMVTAIAASIFTTIITIEREDLSFVIGEQGVECKNI